MNPASFELNAEPENHFAGLVSFIREKTRERKLNITRETLIEDDLGVTGDDASDLILELSRHFGVNIEHFQFAKYFNDEPSVFSTVRKIEPFTVGHLEKAIIAGRLDEEIIRGVCKLP